MADRETQNRWVLSVLGIDVQAAGQNDAKNPSDLLAVWRDAKEEVDRRLEALAGALRAQGDPDLVRIADYGLYGIGTGEQVALMKALLEHKDAGAGRQAASARVLKAAVDRFRALLDTRRAALIDDNPTGIAVNLRSTLGAALDRLERTLA